MEYYLQFVSGQCIAWAGLAAAASAIAFYFINRPISEEPLVPLHQQSVKLLEVSAVIVQRLLLRIVTNEKQNA